LITLRDSAGHTEAVARTKLFRRDAVLGLHAEAATLVVDPIQHRARGAQAALQHPQHLAQPRIQLARGRQVVADFRDREQQLGCRSQDGRRS
jgi:hypothetical protein